MNPTEEALNLADHIIARVGIVVPPEKQVHFRLSMGAAIDEWLDQEPKDDIGTDTAH